MEPTEEMDAILAPRISDDELSTLRARHPPLRHKCSGCAYRRGTEAALSPATITQREICDRAGHPFWCHLQKDHMGMPVRLCIGWLDARAALSAAIGEAAE